jgi:hypothetical protein
LGILARINQSINSSIDVINQSVVAKQARVGNQHHPLALF